jgi:hypothetical protein
MVLASTAAGRVLVAQFGHDPLELCFFLSFFFLLGVGWGFTGMGVRLIFAGTSPGRPQ